MQLFPNSKYKKMGEKIYFGLPFLFSNSHVCLSIFLNIVSYSCILHYYGALVTSWIKARSFSNIQG